jgi:hypothetical protein
LQLGDILREVNVLIFHIHHGLDELIEKLAYLRGGYATQYVTRSKCCSRCQKISADITNNYKCSQNTAHHQCDLGGRIYPQSIKIFVSTSTFARDMQNQ